MKFGTDGLRGRANREITPALAMAFGGAMVRILGPRIGIARDTRPSGPMLEAAVLAGVCGAGGTAVRFGVLPTPGLSALVAGELDGGVMITASHNPAADNGLKALDGRGRKIDAAAREAIQAMLGMTLLAETPGGVEEGDPGRYVRAVLDALPPGRWLAGRTIVLDCANGALVGWGGRVLAALGARIVSIGDASLEDGGEINAGCGAMHPEAMIAAVRAHAADAGIAVDGDADRVVVATSAGEPIDGDGLLWLLRRPPVVVGTIMSNGGLEDALAGEGIRLVRTAVGDANVAAAMEGAWVGAEPSGHVLFSDGLPTGDGLLAGLRAIHPDPRTLADRLTGYTPRPQRHAAVRVAPDRASRCDDVTAALLAEGARVVVRPSGTEPVVRVMVEHKDARFARDGLDRLVHELEKA